MDASDRPGRDRRRVHDLVPFLVPFVLVCAGTANMLALAATPWGSERAVQRFAVTLGLWALVSFGTYRASVAVVRSVGRMYWWTCAFAFFSGALCAAEIGGGFLFVEALVSAFVICAACLETVGAFTTDPPRRMIVAAGCQCAAMAAVMLVNDAGLALAGGATAFVAAIALFLSGPSAERTERDADEE